MSDEEYRIRIEFIHKKVCSVPYLMMKYKITQDKAYEYMKELFYLADSWTKNKEGKIVSVSKR